MAVVANPYDPYRSAVDPTGARAAGRGQMSEVPNVDITGSQAAGRGTMLPPGTRPGWTDPMAEQARNAAGLPTEAGGAKNLWQDMKTQATMDYRGQKFGYNPYQAAAGQEIGAMNYNPYQSAARNSAQSGAASGFAGEQSQLQRTGGLSAADRIRGFSDFNRQKILGQLGGAQKYDQSASQNLLDTQRQNLNRSSELQRGNIAARNEAGRDLSLSNLRREQNLYEGALGERNLNRQLEASALIAAAQGKGGGSILDRFLNPWNVGKDDIINNPFGV